MFAVHDPGARRHALDFAALDHGAVAHGVLVGKRAGDHVGDDFHVAMAVSLEAGAGLDLVLVDHPEHAEPHMGRIVIIAERKAVATVEPAEIGPAPVFGAADMDQDFLLRAPGLDPAYLAVSRALVKAGPFGDFSPAPAG